MRSHRSLTLSLAGLLSLTACQSLLPAATGPAPAAASGATATAGMPATNGTLAGLVTDASGAPLGGAHLLIVGHGILVEATSAQDGRFRVEVPAGSAYDVSAVAPAGGGRQWRAHATGQPATSGEATPLALRLMSPGAVTGQIMLPGEKETTPAGTEIHLAEVPGVSATADARGHFRLGEVPDGVWTLVVQRPGFQRARLERIVVKDGREVALLAPIKLLRDATGAEVRGTIRDKAGLPVTGALVTLWPATATSTRSRYHTRADANGAFSIAGLTPGAYHLQVSRRLLTGTAKRELTLTAGAVVEAGDLVLPGALNRGQVEGQVVSEAGGAIAGLEVRLAHSGVPPTKTDGAGRFVFKEVPYGDYGLEVAATDHPLSGHDVHVAAAVVSLGTPVLVPSPASGAQGGTPNALHRPHPTLHAGALSWPPVGRPAGVPELEYDLEVEDAPGQFSKVATVAGNAVAMPPQLLDRQVRVRARAKDAPYGSGSYQLTEANMFSPWRYAVLGIADTGAVEPAFATLSHGLDRVYHLVAGGGYVYALGASGFQGSTPLTKGALAYAAFDERSAFTRLYNHDKSLNFVAKPGKGLNVEVYGSGTKFSIAGTSATNIREVTGKPFGAEWADVISGPAVRLPNFAWVFTHKGSMYNILDAAATYVLSSYPTGRGDAWIVSRAAGADVPVIATAPGYGSSLATVGTSLYVLGEDLRYPGLKLVARYNLDGQVIGDRSDPFDNTRLGEDPSQLHGDPWGKKLYVVNKAGGRDLRGTVAVLDENAARLSTLETPQGWLLAGMAVARNTETETIWVAYNATGSAHVRKYTGGTLVKTVDLPGVTIPYNHNRAASNRTIAATDAACWLLNDQNQVLRVQ